MRTLGVDLVSQPVSTGIAVVTWAQGRAVIDHLELAATDARIVELASGADAVGIDSPFGWPVEFAQLLAGELAPEAWTDDYRDRLRFRRTDVAARSAFGRWPLSVSSELIAVPAMRCQGLLARLNVADRSGDGRVFEVYPALALHRWALPSSGYKRQAGADARAALWRLLADRASWLTVTEAQEDLIRRSADALDAILSALVARAAALGDVDPIPPSDRERARIEGWIAIPTPASFERLAAGRTSY